MFMTSSLLATMHTVTILKCLSLYPLEKYYLQLMRAVQIEEPNFKK